MTGIVMALALAGVWAPPEQKSEFTFRPLGDLPNGRFESRAYGISAKGKVVVGTGNGKFGREGFVWTAKDGMQSIGLLFPVGSYSEARAVSPDGSTVVGFSHRDARQLPIKWTEKSGLVSLGAVPGTGDGEAIGVDDHGKIIGNSSAQELTVAYKTGGISRVGRLPVPIESGLKRLQAGGLIGWTRTGESYERFNAGIEPIDFFMVDGSLHGDPSWVEFRVGTDKTPHNLQFEGEFDLIGCQTLGDVSLAGISADGARICGEMQTHAVVPNPANYVLKEGGERVYYDDRRDSRMAFVQMGEKMVELRPGKIPKGGRVRQISDSAHPTAISADGSVVVGYQGNDSDHVLAVWRILPSGIPQTFLGWIGPDVDGDAVYRGGVERYVRAKAWAVSSDGGVVVGERFSPPETVSTIALPWKSSAIVLVKGCDRWILLEDLLKVYCPDAVKGWVLQSARGVSWDGKTVVGYGTNPEGKTEAWVVTLGDLKKPWEELMNPAKKPADDGEE